MTRTVPVISVLGWMVLALAISLTAVSPAAALDMFTLWRQAEIPLHMEPGSWVEYRTQVMAGGRQQEDLVRLVCLADSCADGEPGWFFELLPLSENDKGVRRPIPGEGLHLCLAPEVSRRQGRLIDAVRRVVQWHEGKSEELATEQWRDDPLVAASFSGEFTAQRTESLGRTNRVIEAQQLSCEQFVLSSADTQSVELPAGRMVQITTREVSVAVNEEIPFLGIAYAAERVRADSHLEAASSRLSPPPPRARVEIMELLAFGQGAEAWLTGTD